MLPKIFRPDDSLLDQAANIRAFRETVSRVRNESKKDKWRLLKSPLIAMLKAINAATQLRYAFTSPIRPHDWIVAFDGMRTRPHVSEDPRAYLTRVCRTNRSSPLPDIIGLGTNDRFIMIDIARLHGKSAESFGTLAFLFSLAGPLGLLRLTVQTFVGFVATRSPTGGFLYGALDMVRHREALSKQGLFMTTSTTWLAEILRVGLLAARPDVKVIEVLHGASIKSVVPYFEWVHEQSISRPVYVNLIAGLPRFFPQSAHLLKDQQGEIACNIRLWQERENNMIQIPRDRFSEAPIVLIGGASADQDYEFSTFFAKERDLVIALRQRVDTPIRYCVHPKHKKASQAKLVARMLEVGAKKTSLSTQDEIFSARIVVGGFSTSLIEASLLGRHAFSYEDMGALFIPEIAQLVRYNCDIDVIADQIAQEILNMSQPSVESDFKVVCDFARNRYGLELELL